MSRNLSKSLVLLCACSMLIFIATKLLRLDFSQSNFSPGDLSYMLSLPAVIYLFFLCALLLIINRFIDKRASWLIPFLLVAILTVAFPLMQYPSIDSWDSFGHGSTVISIESNAHIPSYAGYFVYPGAFILSTIFSQIIGCSVLEASMLLVSFLNILIVSLLLLAGWMIIGREKSWIVPTIFFAFSFTFDVGLLHYCPQLLGFCLYVLFVCAIVTKSKSSTNREVIVLSFVLLSALMVIHPFSAFLAVITLSCIYIFGNRLQSPFKLRNRQLISFLLAVSGCLLFISWHVFVAVVSFESSIRSLVSILQRGKSSSFLQAIIYKPVPGALTQIIAYYRYGVYGLFATLSFLCILLFWRRQEIKLTTLLLLGALLEGIAVYFTPAIFGVGHIVLFAGVPVSLLTSYLIKNLKNQLLSKPVKVLEALIPFLIIGTFLVSYLYVSTYTIFMHPDEVSAAQFAARKIERQISTLVDDALIIQFYANESVPMQIINPPYVPLVTAKEILNKADASLQYLPRQQYYYNLGFVGDEYNLVYSNGLSRIYVKTNVNSTK